MEDYNSLRKMKTKYSLKRTIAIGAIALNTGLSLLVSGCGGEDDEEVEDIIQEELEETNVVEDVVNEVPEPEPTPTMIWVYWCDGGIVKYTEINEANFNPAIHSLTPISCGD